MSADEFLDRVVAHLGRLKPDRFSHVSWRFENRPTAEAVGMLPRPDTDVEAMVAHILDVAGYTDNVRYVEDIEIIEQRSDSDVTYVQHMNLPLIGRIQVQIHLADYGDWEGYRVIAWDQDEAGTMGLDPKRGFRTAYNLGAWLLQPDAVAYALSSSPLKSDVGTLKYLALTKGGDVTAGDVMRQNIDAMIAWAERG